MLDIGMKDLNIIKWLNLLMGVLMVVGSFFYIKDPMGSTMMLVIGIGVILILIGIMGFVKYFTNELFRRAGILIEAIVDIIFGVFIIYNKSASFVAFAILIAFWVLFRGVINVANSFDAKKYQVDKWWLLLITGIINIIAGFLLIRNIHMSIAYISIIVSLSMLWSGIMLISLFFKLDKYVHQIKLKIKSDQEKEKNLT